MVPLYLGLDKKSQLFRNCYCLVSFCPSYRSFKFCHFSNALAVVKLRSPHCAIAWAYSHSARLTSRNKILFDFISFAWSQFSSVALIPFFKYPRHGRRCSVSPNSHRLSPSSPSSFSCHHHRLHVQQDCVCGL